MTLSILICSIESRGSQLIDLLGNLTSQLPDGFHPRFDYQEKWGDGFYIKKTISKEVEIVFCIDNKQMKVGDKRNLLLSQSTGEYVTFIDDDDKVSADYISALLEGVKSGCDVIVFDAKYYHNGKFDRPVKYGIDYMQDHNRPQAYYRIPNHLMCVKREHALRVGFKPISFGEDADYAKRLLPHLKTQHRIEKCLYEYWFNDKTTETQRR